MADDFQGSIAQEDIQFITEIVTEVNPGDNYSKLMIFIEKTKYVEDAAAFVAVNADIDMAIVTANNYTLVTKGLLLAWLADFFAGQTTAKVYLVAFTDDLATTAAFDAAVITLLTDAFNELKALAYWKTILVTTTATNILMPIAASTMAGLCGGDTLLTSPAMLPLTTATPGTLSSDPIYVAVEALAIKSAFFVYHYDDQRNGALLQLGISLGVVNGSGTAVGNSFDFVATTDIDASGDEGVPLSVTVQEILKAANVSYFKPVGDTTGAVVLVGAKTIAGNVVSADWIVSYCNYVNKVRVANFIARMNQFRNNNTYQGILLIMSDTVGRFTTSGSGRLANFKVTAPPFSSLPAAGSTITVPNAWSALYLDNVRSVLVYGQLTIVSS